MDLEQQIGKTLANESGMPPVGVCIWRKDGSVDIAFKGTVGEFLSKPENQTGTWLIDGGWGGPPGPIHVRWDDKNQKWINGGYNGGRFIDEATGKDAATLRYEAAMNHVATTSEPEGQKYKKGARVKIADDLRPYKTHFPSGVEATVLYTYAHAYGGNDVRSYALDVDNHGHSAWYEENEITAIYV